MRIVLRKYFKLIFYYVHLKRWKKKTQQEEIRINDGGKMIKKKVRKNEISIFIGETDSHGTMVLESVYISSNWISRNDS